MPHSGMTAPLRVLHLEDNPDYSALVQSKLAAEGFEPQLVCVDKSEAFEAALRTGSFDLILADYSLPGYDGIQALRLARELAPETPILLVSGTIGEDAAIASLRAGASDYVLKHWPERLVPAVRRVLREAGERQSRLRAESSLIRQEKLFRALSENALDIVTILDREGNFTYNSRSMVRMLGYQPEEVHAQNAFNFLHPEDVPAALEAFQKAMTHPELTVTHAFRFRHKDGSWRHLESVGQSLLHDPEIGGVVINSRDVSNHQRAEQYNAALSKLGLRLSSATTAEAAAKVIVETADGLFRWDACTLSLHSAEDDKIVPVLAIDTIGGVKKEIPRQEIDTHPTPRSRRILRQGAELILREEPIHLSTDGVTIGDKARPSASLMFVPIRNGTRVIGILSLQSYQLKAYGEPDLAALQTLADYCGGALERIHVEQALRESEKRFFHLFEGSPDAIFVEDSAGNILDVNPAAGRLHGVPPEELIGRNAMDLIPEAKREHARQNFQRLVRGELAQIEGASMTAEGRVVPVEIRTSCIDYGGNPALLLHVRDVSERRKAEEAVLEQKRLEDQLRQSQKMDAIGQLAGGVAHDFNNILTVIQGHASLLRNYGELTERAVGSAEQISQAAERAATLTRQLLTFSRRQMMQPKILDLNGVVSHMTRMLGRILGEDIALQFNYSPILPQVRADVGMMEQVLLNLAVNSRDAMPSGGRLTIQISVQEIAPVDVARHPGGRAGHFACLSVNDTGCGIKPENLPRIFEPFFTTKEVGKGTGLGLATVYGIVKQHEGWLEVESELNKGTTLRVFLPWIQGSAEADEQGNTQCTVRGGTETILVVEDESAVRALVCQILKSHGYQVLEAETGVAALKVWREHRDRVDLLLTDIVMPDGMTGRDLAEKVQLEKPGLKAIFTSGYSSEIVGKDFILQEGLNFLQKPYHAQKLAAAVRKCLDED
jgi:PAS domain S-box-containing protein